MNNRQKNIIFQYFKNRNISMTNNGELDWRDYEYDYSNSNLGLKEYFGLFKDKQDRTLYFNKKFGTNYDFVGKFKYANNSIALVKRNKDEFFINKKNEPTIEGITDEDIMEMPPGTRGTYFNIIQDKYEFKKVNEFDFADGNLATARLKNNKNRVFFINKKGELSVKGLDFNKLHSYYKAYYINTIQDEYVYFEVLDFKFANNTIALAETSNYNYVFINKKGKPSIDGITDEDVDRMIEYQRTCYYNQKLRKNIFYSVHFFDYANNTIALAELDVNFKTVFINREGKPSVKGITDEDIQNMSKPIRADYYNQKYEKFIFKDVGKWRNGVLKDQKSCAAAVKDYYFNPRPDLSKYEIEDLEDFNDKIIITEKGKVVKDPKLFVDDYPEKLINLLVYNGNKVKFDNLN